MSDSHGAHAPLPRRRRLPAWCPVGKRRLRPVLAGSVLLLGLALVLPSCHAASRWSLFRMTPATSDYDSTSLGSEGFMNDPNITWNCTSEGLNEGLLTALRAVAAEYMAEAGQPIVINSGARSLQRQAELMSAMSRSQLEGMYCRQGYPGYIQRIIAARQANRGTLDAEATYAILRNRDDGFISSHLSGAAVDVSPSGSDVRLLRRLLEKHGFTTLDERGLGINCLHATYRHAPRLIVRQ
jgi:hypothetical protein